MTQQDDTILPAAVFPTREEIAAAAADVNAASDELNKSVSVVELYLETRNIGVPAWVKVKAWANDGGEYWSRELGYDRDGHAWQLMIRETSGHQSYPDQEHIFTWTFHNAPRKARISAVDKIPELVRELVKQAGKTARRLREKAVEVNAFAANMNIQMGDQKVKK